VNAMILAAGRGERMRPLTDRCPKPLLEVGGAPLIVWHLRRLREAGFARVVINHAHLGHMIEQALGDGARFGLDIRYSPETEALETAGGIVKALPLLGGEPFLVVNGDIFCDWPMTRARTVGEQMAAARLSAWCVLIANPSHNTRGDFTIEDGMLGAGDTDRRTYSGIGVFAPRLFVDCVAGHKAPLAPLLRASLARGEAGAEYFDGRWVDVGTPERLAELDGLLTREPEARL
jgi:N-acetyl-alpha-D-muramate 1-phosphate uridylyltransferase